MRKDFGPKPWLYPLPVLILAAYDENGEPMAMNVGWAGMVGKDRVAIGLGKHHKTTKNLLKTGAFTLSPATASRKIPCDYVGIDSGNQVPDKMLRSGFHTEKAPCVNAPLLEELPLCAECRVLSYDEDQELLLGRILNISAQESILGEDGRIDAEKAGFLTLDPGQLTYRTLGPVAGKAFHDGIVLSARSSAKPFDDEKDL